jgi:hypothetical protein
MSSAGPPEEPMTSGVRENSAMASDEAWILDSDGHTGRPAGWIERVASRYFSIWVWSIVVGVSTTTTLSLTNYFIRSKGSFLSILIAPLFFMSAMSLLMGWYGTVRFFDTFILQLFTGDPPDYERYSSEDLEKRHYYDRYRAGRFLSMSVRFAVIGVAFRLLLSLADILLSGPFD